MLYISIFTRGAELSVLHALFSPLIISKDWRQSILKNNYGGGFRLKPYYFLYKPAHKCDGNDKFALLSLPLALVNGLRMYNQRLALAQRSPYISILSSFLQPTRHMAFY